MYARVCVHVCECVCPCACACVCASVCVSVCVYKCMRMVHVHVVGRGGTHKYKFISSWKLMLNLARLLTT